MKEFILIFLGFALNQLALPYSRQAFLKIEIGFECVGYYFMSAFITKETYAPAVSNCEAFIKALLLKTKISDPIIVKILDFMMKIICAKQKSSLMDSSVFTAFFSDLMSTIKLLDECLILGEISTFAVMVLIIYSIIHQPETVERKEVILRFLDCLFERLTTVSIPRSILLCLLALVASSTDIFEELICRKSISLEILLDILNTTEYARPLPFQVEVFWRLLRDSTVFTTEKPFQIFFKTLTLPVFDILVIHHSLRFHTDTFIQKHPTCLFYNRRTFRYSIYDATHKQNRPQRILPLIIASPVRPFEKLRKLLQLYAPTPVKLCLVDLSSRELLETTLSSLKLQQQKGYIFIYLKKQLDEGKSLYYCKGKEKSFPLKRRISQTLDYIEKSSLKSPKRPHILIEGIPSVETQILDHTTKLLGRDRTLFIQDTRTALMNSLKKEKLFRLALFLIEEFPSVINKDNGEVILWTQSAHILAQMKKLRSQFPKLIITKDINIYS